MFGGDEINAIVVDVGSNTVKAGFAGEDQPKSVFPSVRGLQKVPFVEFSKAALFVGSITGTGLFPALAELQHCTVEV